MIKRLCMLVSISLVIFSAPPALAAIQTFFGEDLNGSSIVPLTAYAKASEAEARFLSNLVVVGTESFEGFANGAITTPLDFPGVGTATFGRSSGEVVSRLAGVAEDGLYGITNDGGEEKYFEVAAGEFGSFVINFSTPIAAFGFYGIDVGDFGGQLELQTASGTGGSYNRLLVPHDTTSDANGAVFYFGFIATTPAEWVTSLEFISSDVAGDYFGFDNFTIASLDQVQQQSTESKAQRTISANPEPVGLVVWGALIALAATFASLRRNRTGHP